MSFTNLYELESIDYGVTGWDGILTSNFQKLEDVINTRVLGVLGENLGIGRQAVYMKADGKWYRAQANGTDQPCMGIALCIAPHVADETVRIQIRGMIDYGTWNWTTGGIIYLSGTLGELTQTPPASPNRQPIGVAYDPDIILMDGNLRVF